MFPHNNDFFIYKPGPLKKRDKRINTKDNKDSPFKKDNEHKVLKTLVELNRTYKKHKDDRFIEKVYANYFA